MLESESGTKKQATASASQIAQAENMLRPDDSLEEFDNKKQDGESIRRARQLDTYKKVSVRGLSVIPLAN